MNELKKALVYVLICIFLNVPGAVFAARIFILMSYSVNDTCGGPQLQGVMDILHQKDGKDINTKIFCLNSKSLPKEKVEERRKEARERFKAFSPDVSISIDDTAFQTLAPFFTENTGHGYLVFTGTNISPEEYNQRFHFHKKRIPTGRITGVYENLLQLEQFTFFSIINNKPGKVAILYSDDPVARIVLNQILDELKGTRYETSLLPMKASTLEEVKRYARKIETDPEIKAYIPITFSIKDSKGPNSRQLKINDIAPLLLKTIHKPDLAVNSSFVKLGFFGGVSIDFYAMGKEAGNMAMLLLNGYKISHLCIRDAHEKKIVINISRAKEVGLHLTPSVMALADRLVK